MALIGKNYPLRIKTAASRITLPNILTAAYTTLEDANTLFHSAGELTGGIITDAGSETFDVAAGEPEVERNSPGTAPDYAEVDLQPGDGIAHQMYDLVALPYAEVQECISYPVGILVKLSPGDFLPQLLAGGKFYQGCVVGVCPGVVREHLRYIHSFLWRFHLAESI